MPRELREPHDPEFEFLDQTRRRAMDEKNRAVYLRALATFVDRHVWRVRHIKGPVHLYGRLYYDRRRRSYVRQVRRHVFQSLTPSQVARGYHTLDVLRGMVESDPVQTRKKE